MQVNQIKNPGMSYFSAPGIMQMKSLSETIIDTVCKEFDVKYSQLQARIKKSEFVEPRQIAAYLMKKHTKLSLAQIGAKFKRDHATVIHSCKVVENLISVYPNKANLILLLESKIMQYGKESSRNN